MNRLLVLPLLAACTGYAAWTMSNPVDTDQYALPGSAAGDGVLLEPAEVNELLVGKWKESITNRQMFSRAARPIPHQFHPEFTVHEPEQPIQEVFAGRFLLRHENDAKLNQMYPFVIDRRTGHTFVYGNQGWREFTAWAKSQ